MKTPESIIQELQDTMQTEPNMDLRKRIMQSAQSEVTRIAPQKRRLHLKPALLAATFALLLLTAATAFAYGDAIKAFIFGDSQVRQLETIDENDTAIAFHIEGRIPEAENYTERYDVEIFDSLEAANAVSLFPIYTPQDLPPHVVLEKIDVLRFSASNYAYDARLHFSVNGEPILHLFQYYAGPNAHVVLETTYAIEKIALGDIEASLLRTEDGTIYLYWMKNDTLYELFDSHESGLSLETLLEIAESI